MEIIITNGGNAESWYRNKVGQKFTVVNCKLGSSESKERLNVYNPEDGLYEQSTVLKSDCELVMPQAIKTTEQPSKAAAVEGILTEEELKEWEEDTRELLPAVSEYRIKRLINSHRNLLSANAELKAENFDLKAENFDLKASVILNVRENKRLREELK